MEMRRFDVWVGRLAAIAGIVYVLLASLWPLAASAAEGSTDAVAASLHAVVDHDEATIEMLPMEVALLDIRIGRVIAEVVGRREREGDPRPPKTRRRPIACLDRPSDGDRSCDRTSSASLLPDSSTMTILAIPLVALAFAAASALRERRLLTA